MLLLVHTIDSAELIVIISLNNVLLSFKSLLAFDSEIVTIMHVLYSRSFGNQTKQNRIKKTFPTIIID